VSFAYAESQMTAFLPEQVHAVDVYGDLVALDLRSGRYHCLPGLGDGFDPQLPLAEPLAEALARQGLGGGGERPAARLAPAARAQRDLPDGEGSRGPRLAADMAAAHLAANVRVRILSFSAILDRVPAARPLPAAPERGLRDVRAFLQWLPWAPLQGRCLMRAAMLRTFLVRRGHPAPHWVFGVSTYPFAAHCWLQWGDMALDDQVGRLVRYTPILAR
jgi:hypothetical protein